MSGAPRPLDGDTVRALLDEAGVANARITGIAELPQLVERGRWLTTPVPGGEARTVHPPGLPGPPRDDFGAVPELGAHTDAVLAAVRTPDEIARLRELGVVGARTGGYTRNDDRPDGWPVGGET